MGIPDFHNTQDSPQQVPKLMNKRFGGMGRNMVGSDYGSIESFSKVGTPSGLRPINDIAAGGGMVNTNMMTIDQFAAGGQEPYISEEEGQGQNMSLTLTDFDSNNLRLNKVPIAAT